MTEQHRHPAEQTPELRRDQSRSAFEDALTSEMPHVRSYALSLTRDAANADDLVQDCMVRALKNWQSYAAGTHMRRWLFTIVRNRHLDRCRSESRRGQSISIDDCPQGTLGQRAAQDDWMALRDCGRKLREARACDREILFMRVFSGLSNEEIARRLGIAEGTVRSRLSRMRAQMRA
ncbi:RNA polymerase sigma factor [Roseivivax isoporae]|uniref:RNA polymerase subunit sigma-24 n=1 Tax=Roseivivax isoporae LMG 25204 TaxID=1449351 RepID=X7F8H2_9RHOB|nr:sigma-70 family RNA polymerase sigma factor [Roseivivax isoporae]ETX29207.1 RNA polymerase subunit sigma-24 [Roseivivax isoporae LMG 25204]